MNKTEPKIKFVKYPIKNFTGLKVLLHVKDFGAVKGIVEEQTYRFLKVKGSYWNFMQIKNIQVIK